MQKYLKVILPGRAELPLNIVQLAAAGRQLNYV